MRVKELIEMLSSVDNELNVCVVFDMGYEYVEIVGIRSGDRRGCLELMQGGELPGERDPDYV